MAATVLLAVCTPEALTAAELKLADGVVVKYGDGAQLVVRDALKLGRSVVMSSVKDDAVGGQTGATAAIAAAGDWRGVRIEKSAAATALPVLDGLSVFYAGGSDGAALQLRGLSGSFQALQFANNGNAMRLLDGASVTLGSSSLSRNQNGIDVDANSALTVSGSQFVGHSGKAINNQSSSKTVLATGNWWGHASGPQEPNSNPAGQGDAVSTRVNFAAFLSAAPMLNPSARLAAPAAYFEDNTVVLDIACNNAVAYRIAEGSAFAGVPFVALNNGAARVVFSSSIGSGPKAINVQFKDAGGTIVSTAVVEPVLIDKQAPLLTLNNPSDGSQISDSINLEASASDDAGIARLEFYVDGNLLAALSAAPYSKRWDVAGVSDGVHLIKAVATDLAGRSVERSASVTLSRTPPAPDTEGPKLSGFALNGAALSDGVVLQRDATLSLTASDRSGVARVQMSLDGSPLSVVANGSTYSALLSIQGLANGAHALNIQAFDTLGNTNGKSYALNVAHVAPDAPAINTPGDGSVTRNAEQAIAGTAAAGSSVQLMLAGKPVGAPLVVGGDGRFSTTITLSPGDNLIQAIASDAYGSSPASRTVKITLDITVPASPTNLSATAQATGKVHLTWSRSADANLSGYEVYRASSAFDDIRSARKVNAGLLGSTVFDDLPPADGSWVYRVVAVNKAGTASAPTNAAQVNADSAAPYAVSVQYKPAGKTDPLSGRVGQGRVDVTLTVNEALAVPPYLAIVPQGGAPITVDLQLSDDLHYSGSFLIDANTPSGLANALFSARDAVGNRGTSIQTGASLLIDTQGPQVTSLSLTPNSPIKNDGSPTLQATFSFDKAPALTPQLGYKLSGPVRSPVGIANVTRVDAKTYRGTFTLPSDAGMGTPEVLSFSYQAQDELDNVANKISVPNRFQVYQGGLPPPNVPVGFTAKAQPGGKIRLSWQAVEDASSYQIYRQSPLQSGLQPLTRTSGTDYIDQAPQDGNFKYAVAAVRQANGQESLSSNSQTVDVQAIANAPGSPQNLTLRLTGQGIYASWQPPLASNVDYYNLYRAGGTSIGSIDGLTPVKTRVKTPQTYDPAPNPNASAYVVTAVDSAGNESAVSNSVYLNASLLPVSSLKVEQLGNELPRLSWTAPNGNIAGYLVYVGAEAAKTKLTSAPITALSLTDTGFSSGERRYTVATVDGAGVEMPRSLTLPNVMAQVVGGTPLKRGIMNRLQVQVGNLSSSGLDNVRVVVRVPINKEGTQFKDHKSSPFSLAGNDARLIPVIVGGYADLPSTAQAQVGVEAAPNEGELVTISRAQALDVIEGSLVVGMATEDFVRGGEGKLKLTIENSTDVDIELLTAQNNGNDPSSELRFRILDNDGNVLATQPYKQVLGANVVTLTNGQTVARIPAGASYVSDVFRLNVPASSPNSIRVLLDVDKLRYHSAQDDAVQVAGKGSERRVSLIDTAYIGQVTDVSPVASFGDQDVTISGRALDRSGSTPLPNSRLKLILNQQGFERTVSVITDASGGFVYTFKPTLTDSGLYRVSAVHPDITDRPEQKSFTINRVTVGPTPYRLDVPKNYPFTIPFTAKAGVGTSASNLRLSLDAASQPTGQLPAGVRLELPAPINLAERQTLNLPVKFVADDSAQPSGTLILNVFSDEHAATPIGQLSLIYALSEAKPYLVSSPSYVETGLSQGGSQLETVTVRNNGVSAATNLKFVLSKADGSAAPAWVSISSQTDGSLGVGETRSIDLNFAPPAGTPEGVYELKLNVTGDNVPAQAINIYASVTQSGKGNLLFKVSDIYTATLGKDGKLIAGLQGATITVQNEDVETVSREVQSDTLGEALLQELPAGRYKFRVKANNHQETAGRILVKPGITGLQPVFLDYNLITVEWSVREITIQDRYEITLNATFETDVPAAVVVMQPSSVNLPKMRTGDIYYGELNLTNYGLIRADKVTQQLPKSDPFFRYEFLGELPSSLESKQRVTLPYRVIALQSPEDAAAAGNSSGGGCYGYSNTTSVNYLYQCKAGNVSSGSSATSWFQGSSSTCSGPSSGSGGGGAGGYGGGGYGGGGGLGGSASTTIKMKGKKCVFLPKGGTKCDG